MHKTQQALSQQACSEPDSLHGLHRLQRIRSRPSLGFGIPELPSFPHQVGGISGEGLASENLLPKLCELLMVRHVGCESFDGASLVLGQLPVNGGWWLPMMNHRLWWGLPQPVLPTSRRRHPACVQPHVVRFTASLARCRRTRTRLMHWVEAFRPWVGLSTAQHSPARSRCGNSRAASPSHRLGRGWECSIRGMPQRGR